MKVKRIPFLVLILILLASLSCNMLYSQPRSEKPAPAEPSSKVYTTAITTGSMHACALLNTGTVKCWGSNSEGQLGDGTYTSHTTPVEVPGLENVTAISAGGEHTCALLSDGEVKCFGANIYGQLGDGTKDKRWTPTQVTGLTDVAFIAAGDEHTCTITRENGTKCWGKNLYNRIGSGTYARIFPTPVDVIGLAGNPMSIAPGY